MNGYFDLRLKAELEPPVAKLKNTGANENSFKTIN